MTGATRENEIRDANVISLPEVLQQRRLSAAKAAELAFPYRWRTACREIIKLFQAELRKTDPRRAGTKTIRNLIMEDFDFTDGALLPDDRLTKGDLDAWLVRETEIGPKKFQFIDRYVRRLQFDDHYRRLIAPIIIASKEVQHKEVLREIYRPYHLDDQPWVQEFLDEIQGTVLLSRPVSEALPRNSYSLPLGLFADNSIQINSFEQICVYLRSSEGGVLSATIAYLDEPITSARDLIENRRFALGYGYIIPQKDSAGVENNHLDGLIEVSRPAARGLWLDIGNSYSSISFFSHEKGIFQTNWHNQIAIYSPHMTGGNFKSEEERGSFTFKHCEFDSTEIAEYLKNLTNEYLIW